MLRTFPVKGMKIQANDWEPIFEYILSMSTILSTFSFYSLKNNKKNLQGKYS